MDKPIFKMLIGASIVGIGVYLITGDSIFIGIALIILGGTIFNGASHGVWFSFHSNNDDIDGGDSGGEMTKNGNCE